MLEDCSRLDVAVKGICQGARPVGSKLEFVRGTSRLSCWVLGGSGLKEDSRTSHVWRGESLSESIW